MDISILQQLLRPQAFSHPTDTVTLRETHISWVVLAGDFAYKIKKPVDFGFLDFSTLALRHHFCEQEVMLNRRFAPELYLGVVAITDDSAGPRFAGDGPVIEYAVQMRRFDEAQLLDNIAARGELDRKLVRALAREIARCQEQAPVCHPGSGEPGSADTLLAAMEQNFHQAREFTLGSEQLEQLAALEQWTLQRHTASQPLLERRANDGRVIDGHGDAHLGNIALIDEEIRLFDCIEFNPALRIMDSIGEIALLSMDMEARGMAAQAHWLVADYLEYRGDYQGLALLELYHSYFAMVRAKVALLREPEQRESIQDSAAYADFSRYLALASRYCSTTEPFLAITHGVSGSGKSTIADKLAAPSGAIRIRSDVERKRLFGLQPEQRSRPQDEEQLYGGAMSDKTFTRLEQIAVQVLAAGFAVIVDATFLHRHTRDRFRQLAEHLNIPFVIIDCKAPPETLRQRLLARSLRGQDASEADVTVMEKQQLSDQPPGGVELPCRMAADSSEDAAALWRRLQSLIAD